MKKLMLSIDVECHEGLSVKGRDTEILIPFSGNACRIFIENSRHDKEGWHPMIVTDSKCLCKWERMNMIATVDGTAKGVFVRIYGQEE